MTCVAPAHLSPCQGESCGWCKARARKTRRPVAEASARQEDVLTAVRELAAAGEQPSSYAVAEKLGIARQVAHRHLLALERKGLVRDVPKTVRGGRWSVT